MQLKEFQNISLEAFFFSSEFPDEFPGGWFSTEHSLLAERISHRRGLHQRQTHKCEHDLCDFTERPYRRTKQADSQIWKVLWNSTFTSPSASVAICTSVFFPCTSLCLTGRPQAPLQASAKIIECVASLSTPDKMISQKHHHSYRIPHPHFSVSLDMLLIYPNVVAIHRPHSLPSHSWAFVLPEGKSSTLLMSLIILFSGNLEPKCQLHSSWF